MSAEFEEARQVWKNARHNGLTLRVPKDRDVVIATPKSRVTPELAAGIREHKDELMRQILLDQAMGYLADRYVSGADLSRLRSHERDLEEARDEPLGNYRQAIRAYVEAGLEEFDRARGQKARAS